MPTETHSTLTCTHTYSHTENTYSTYRHFSVLSLFIVFKNLLENHYKCVIGAEFQKTASTIGDEISLQEWFDILVFFLAET